ncbi:MAG: ATP-binding cassette domain-containing protein, partial [Nanoarchaeota archaeon]|nr:ATP-binding cassette domain-containing protein [Nanoarchaeota archaeon]
MSCIIVDHLSKLYGTLKAVDDVVLTVKSGQVFGFLGPNGAGKSTTIKLLTTL